MTDLTPTGLSGAFAVGVTDDGARFDNWGGLPVPARTRLFHQLWADQYVRLLADGDTGAAFIHLNRLRHEEPDADPWRLAELIGKRALARAGEPGPAEAAAQAATPEREDTPDVAE